MSDQASLETGPEFQPQKRLLSRFFKGEYPIPTEEERKPYGYTHANIISKIFFHWVTPIIRVGYSRTIRPADLFVLTEDFEISFMVAKFNVQLDKTVTKYRQRHESNPSNKDVPFKWPKYTLVKVVLATLLYEFTKSAVLGSIAMIFMSLMPLLTKQLIRFVESYSNPDSNESIGVGIGYAIGCSFATLVTGFLFNHFTHVGLTLGIKVKSILTAAVLAKSFKLSPASRRKHTSGKITSLMGTDLSRVELGCFFSPLLMILPISLAIAIAILAINIGVSTLVGLAVFGGFLVAIGFGTSKMFSYRTKITKLTDTRVDIVKEVIHNLKMIKFYSWELPYLSKVINARSAEIEAILKIQAVRNIINSFALSLTGITAMVSFLVMYAINGTTKGPAEIFSSVSTFEVLSVLSFLLPMCLSSAVDLMNAFKRIERYLSSEEISISENYKTIRDPHSMTAIGIENGEFSWDLSVIPDDEDEIKEKKKEAEKKEKELKKQEVKDKKIDITAASVDKEIVPLQSEKTSFDDDSHKKFLGLKNINLSIRKGEFVVITGVIGSGKSSLLHAMAGGMRLDSGEVTVDGSHLMCGEPWVQNATIRENILFGSIYDETLYRQVIYACSLQQDLDSFDAGDFTEVGERGITLSGGQKARINLARAVYANPDVLLLDDVLSAVDARVGKHIMNECIMGQLRNKTRLLATHQLSFVEFADKIIFLNGDGSIDVGTLEVLKSNNAAFAKLLSFSGSSSMPTNTEEEVEEPEIEKVIASTNPNDILGQDKLSLNVTSASNQSSTDDDDDEIEPKALPIDLRNGKLHKEEEKAVNKIKFTVYIEYVRAGVGKLGVGGFFLLFVLSAALATFSSLFTNTFLSFWISNKFPGKSDGFYMGIYAMLTFTTAIFLYLEFFILATVITTSSKNLNLVAMKKLLHAPMSFIDTTPSGRMINRFTKDTDALDNEITESLRFLLYGIANLIGIFILCCIYLPWILIAMPFFVITFICIANYFQATTREIKRIEAVQRSFIHNNYSEVLNGMSTIKSYSAVNRFINLNNKHINTTNEASYLVASNQRWLAIMLELLVFAFTLMITLMCVNRVFKINAASSGLIIGYTFSLGNELSQAIRLYTQVENDMNSAERIQQYAFHMDQEAPFEIASTKPDLSWPQNGQIEFKNVSLSYRKGLPNVLKGLNFNVKAGEKIGICGRTGAGKSSIMTALFRIVELSEGQVLVDGIDVSKIGLHDLRSNLSIIPQDPVLFTGTIRRNLDPFGEKSDEDLWDALRRAGVIEESKIEYVKQQTINDTKEMHKFHLDQEVEEQGANFSLGERQFISFARALLRNTKILILDEATSSVDYETDSKIQQTIIREFGDCTILCIAHRIKTILNYDKIVILEDGQLADYDTPWNLFNREGIFNQICEKSSIVASDFHRR
ncbi:oligomycin resistance ATP-dependent permease Yor1p [[Candida] railenensis]|uniref:Oligomycin resistance ATP-dependent permease Yor1p n=1 Tax=[Candida] railenensis TaxID=45579 RepID=A0A9P0QUB4_9ASCO|nr:oligomycin resistance ATP-dependent permease Yor1p [[Candida] railenensis]